MERVTTVINYVTSGILWCLGVLTLLFNLLGAWEAWHLAGFGFIFFLPVACVPQLVSLVLSCVEGERRYIILNLVALAISAGFVALTFCVTSRWFW
jgi:hypothetical protein